MREAIFARTGMDFAATETDFAGAGLDFDSGDKDFNGADVIFLAFTRLQTAILAGVALAGV